MLYSVNFVNFHNCQKQKAGAEAVAQYNRNKHCWRPNIYFSTVEKYFSIF